MALAQGLAVANGKGGVGKTTLATNLAGVAAHSGWRVLLVDLDPQGNVGQDLGYAGDPADDAGQGLLQAIVTGQPVEPAIKSARPHLDVVPAGTCTADLEHLLAGRKSRDDVAAVTSVAKALDPLRERYNVILFDCQPATHSVLVEAALAAAHFLVIPTFRDASSLQGLEKMAAKFREVRHRYNPILELLGVALLNFNPRGVRLGVVKDELELALAGLAPVFQSFVRENANAADHARDLGVLMHEYEEAKLRQDSENPWWERVRTGRKDRVFSKSAGDLAQDYQNLAEEILGRLAERLAGPRLAVTQ